MLTPQQVLARNREIESNLAEAMALTKNPKATRRDLMRAQVLNTRVSALKAGFTPEQIDLHELNLREHSMGVPLTVLAPGANPSELRETRMWQEFIKTGKVEERVGEVGSEAAQIGALATPGTFVPIQFLNRLNAALKAHDPLFDREVVSYEETNGGVAQAPLVSDIENVAEPVAESGDSGTGTDLAVTGHVNSTAKTYRTPIWAVTIEAQQDVALLSGVMKLAEYFFSQRTALGVGRDLVIGDGNSGRILGLMPQLAAAGINPIVASGSAANSGGSETGANSIGTSDILKLLLSVDSAYRSSPKAAWLMNDATLLYISSVLDKFGTPAFRPYLKYVGNRPYLCGKPVYISPSMDSIGASKTPVLFGDFSYWLTRCVPQDAYVKRFFQAPGFVEKGIVGLRHFSRFDGQLLYNGSDAQVPIRGLQNHS